MPLRARYIYTHRYILSGGERVDDGDDEREEEEDRSERFFVGRDREVRRCVFHAHSSEIEWNGS